jgi:hypothetical protein
MDERLDDLARHLDARFDQIDQRFDRVEDGLHDLSGLFLRVGGGIIVGLIGVIAAVLSTG